MHALIARRPVGVHFFVVVISRNNLWKVNYISKLCSRHYVWKFRTERSSHLATLNARKQSVQSRVRFGSESSEFLKSHLAINLRARSVCKARYELVLELNRSSYPRLKEGSAQ